MATIKSTLALEDKMTPTLSKAEKQAVLNAKAYNELDKQLKWLEKTMNDLEKAGKGQSEMAYKLSDAWDRVRNEMKQYADGAKQAEEQNKQTKTSLTELNQGLELVQKGFALAQSAANKMNEMVEYSNNQFNAQYTAATKMHNMMGATPEEIQSLYDYAASLQQMGVLGDEAIISGMGIMSTSATNTERLKELSNAAANATVAMHGLNANQSTYESMAGYFQKALEGQASQLFRNQVLTKKQADYIDSLNSVSEKEAALIQLVAQNFGNANEMLSQTAEGGIMKATNSMNDMKEEMGESLMPILLTFATILNDILRPAVDFLSEHIEILGPIIVALGVALVATTIAQWMLNIAMAANPVGFFITLLVILIAVLGILWEECEGFREFIAGVFTSILKGLAKTYNLFVDVYNGLQEGLQFLSQASYNACSSLIDHFSNAAVAIVKSGNGILGILQKVVDFYNAIASKVGAPTISADGILSKVVSEESIEALRSGAQQALVDLTPATYERKERIAEEDIEKWANEKGEGLKNATFKNWINSKTSDYTKDINDMLDEADKNFEDLGDLSENLNDAINPSGGGGGASKAIQTTSNDKLFTDEDMQLLLDIATRDYKLSYQQITPNITLTFGDIRETADVDDILDQVADRLEEIYDSNLEVPNG